MLSRIGCARVPHTICIRSALVPQCNRLLSTTTEPATTNNTKSKLDKSLFKLFIWVVIFGSLLTHVADRRHRLEDMERRYSLKADILRELTERVRGGDTNITREYIEQELRLVNRMFVDDTGLVMEKMSSLFSFLPSKVDRQEQLERAKNESLEDIKGQILAAMNENSMKTDTGVKPKVDELRTKQLESENYRPQIKSGRASDIIVDRELLEQIRLRQLEEEKQAKHDASDKEHVIVENPGDLSGSTKFL